MNPLLVFLDNWPFMMYPNIKTREPMKLEITKHAHIGTFIRTHSKQGKMFMF